MATVIERRGMWYARFRHQGKEYLRSTGVEVPAKGAKNIKASRTAAENELNRLEAEIKGRESAEATFERLMQAIEMLSEKEKMVRRINFADRLRQGVSASMPIAEVWEVWKNHPNRGHAGAATVAMYKAYWGQDGQRQKGGFRHWLARVHPEVTALHQVSRGMAESYAAHLKTCVGAPRTYNGAITFLSAMFRTLKAPSGLTENVWDEISRAPAMTVGRRNFTKKELRAVASVSEMCWHSHPVPL